MWREKEKSKLRFQFDVCSDETTLKLKILHRRNFFIRQPPRGAPRAFLHKPRAQRIQKNRGEKTTSVKQ